MKIRPTGFVFPARESVELTDENFKEHMADDLARPYWTAIPSAKDVANELVCCVHGIEKSGDVLIRVPKDVYLSLNALAGIHLDIDTSDTICPPTQWAYEQACRTIEELRKKNEEHAVTEAAMAQKLYDIIETCSTPSGLPIVSAGSAPLTLQLDVVRQSTNIMIGKLTNFRVRLKKLAKRLARERNVSQDVNLMENEGIFEFIDQLVPPVFSKLFGPNDDTLGYTLIINRQVIEGKLLWVGRVLELPDVTEFSSEREKLIELLYDTINTSREMCRERSIHFPDPLLYPEEHEDTVMPLGFVYKMMAKLKKNIGRWQDADWQNCSLDVIKIGMNNPDPIDRANFSAMYDCRKDNRGGKELQAVPDVPAEKVRYMLELFGAAFDKIGQQFEGQFNTAETRARLRSEIGKFLYAMISQDIYVSGLTSEENNYLISKVAEEAQQRMIPNV